MGIYSDGNIYGLSISVQSDNELIEVFNKTYSEKMSFEHFRLAKIVYDKIKEDDKKKLDIRFYTSCSSTYEMNNLEFMHWFPGTLASLEEYFKE